MTPVHNAFASTITTAAGYIGLLFLACLIAVALPLSARTSHYLEEKYTFRDSLLLALYELRPYRKAFIQVAAVLFLGLSFVFSTLFEDIAYVIALLIRSILHLLF